MEISINIKVSAPMDKVWPAWINPGDIRGRFKESLLKSYIAHIFLAISVNTI